MSKNTTPMSEIVMDELYYDTMVETGQKVERMLRAHFRKSLGAKGDRLLDAIFTQFAARGGTPRRLIVTRHPNYASKYLSQSAIRP